MGDTRKTQNHNIETLKNLGYEKIRNTSVFKKQENYILSPAVSKGVNGKYWFDVREVNLKIMNIDSLLGTNYT